MPSNGENTEKEGKFVIVWPALTWSPIYTAILWFCCNQQVNAQSWHEVAEKMKTINLDDIQGCISLAGNHNPETAKINETPIFVCIKNDAGEAIFSKFYSNLQQAQEVVDKHRELGHSQKNTILINLSYIPPKDRNPLDNFR